MLGLGSGLISVSEQSEAGCYPRITDTQSVDNKDSNRDLAGHSTRDLDSR